MKSIKPIICAIIFIIIQVCICDYHIGGKSASHRRRRQPARPAGGSRADRFALDLNTGKTYPEACKRACSSVDRALVYGTRCREFESLQARQVLMPASALVFFLSFSVPSVNPTKKLKSEELSNCTGEPVARPQIMRILWQISVPSVASVVNYHWADLPCNRARATLPRVLHLLFEADR